MNQMNALLSKIKTNHICIQTHQFPDPDAIACAYAMQELLANYKITSDICYEGLIDKNSTKKMIEYLQVKMIHTDLDDMERYYDTILLVDSQMGNSNSSSLCGNSIMCIDHHPSFHMQNYDFEDIRTTYGACATIVLQYFLENNQFISQKVATALVYGMQIDTDNFTRGTSIEDVEAFRILFPLCDEEFLNTIHKSRLDRSGIIAYAHSFSHMEFINGICFANVGDDCPDSLVATISDFTLAIDEVQLSVVYTKKPDGIKFSMRSISAQYDTGILIHSMLSGVGEGGGHAMMAGGFIPYKEGRNEEEVIEIVKAKLIYLIRSICES
ncbi:MAG: DHH family phosphoesterase [Lachnospiraceae bacterium]